VVVLCLSFSPNKLIYDKLVGLVLTVVNCLKKLIAICHITRLKLQFRISALWI
jgi:hypothetical protein